MRIADHLSAISGVEPENIRNFACVIIPVGDEPIVVISPDEHEKCIAAMLGQGYLAMTDGMATKTASIADKGVGQEVKPEIDMVTPSGFIPDEG